VRGELITFGRHKPDNGQVGTFLQRDWIFYWDGEESHQLIPINSIKLRGAHNQMNVLTACAIAVAAGFPAEAMLEGVQALNGVPHRLEVVREWAGAEWVNDSKATTPEGSIAAINSFQEPLILLAGGRDKDLPWQSFSSLVLERVKYLVLFGEAADQIEDSLTAELSPGQELIPLSLRVSLPFCRALNVRGLLLSCGFRRGSYVLNYRVQHGGQSHVTLSF
jgi:UDP-N-acetylmuramoylalanine--D-glutamate ligase